VHKLKTVIFSLLFFHFDVLILLKIVSYAKLMIYQTFILLTLQIYALISLQWLLFAKIMMCQIFQFVDSVNLFINFT